MAVAGAGWIAYMVIYIVVALPSITLFLYRGTRVDGGLHPIKAREPKLVAFVHYFFLGITVLLSFQRLYVDDWACWLQLWMAALVILVVANVYMARCIFLYMNFNLTQEMVQARAAREQLVAAPSIDTIAAPAQPNGVADNEENRVEQPISEFTLCCGLTIQKRRILKNDILIGVPCVIITIFLIPVAALTARSNEILYNTGDRCQEHWEGMAFVFAAFVVAYGIGFVVFGFKLRKDYDVFGIRTELKLSAIVGVIIVGPYYVLNNWADPNIAKFNTEVNLSTILIFIFFAFIFGVGILHPLYRSYVDPADIDIETPASIDTPKKLLDSRQGKPAFALYLEGEWSVQHLHFYEDCKKLLDKIAKYENSAPKKRQLQRIVEQTRDLFLEYVPEDCDKVINVGEQKIRRPLMDLHEEIGESEYCEVDSSEEAVVRMKKIEELYAECQRDVYKMLRDSLRRFKRHPEYKKLVADLQNNELARAHLDGDNRRGTEMAEKKHQSSTIV